MSSAETRLPRVWPFPTSWPEGGPLDRCILFFVDDEIPLRLGPLSANRIEQLCTDRPVIGDQDTKDQLVDWAIFVLESFRGDRWHQEFCFLSGAGLKRFTFGVRTSPIASLTYRGAGEGFQVRTLNSVYRLLDARHDTDWACAWLNQVGFLGLPIGQLITERPGPSLQ